MLGSLPVEVDAHTGLDALRESLAGGGRRPTAVIFECATGEEDRSSEVGVPDPAAGRADAHEDLGARVHAQVNELLALLQDWLGDEQFAEVKLIVATRRAVATGSEPEAPNLAQAAVWGLVRSAQTENPGRIALVDIDREEASVGALVAAAVGEEPQLAVREGQILAPRLMRAGAERGLLAPEGVAEWRLQPGGEGTLETLALEPCPEAGRPLAAGQVRVGVRAAGVNFLDVMLTLGAVSPGITTLGGEGAGVVLEVAPDVEDLAVGDRVMGLLPGAFGPVAVTDRRAVVRMPEGWSFVQAAAIPVAFLTAYYALFELGELQPGERLLVHAAAGGVGMAAVQLGRHFGAEVWGTASPKKWSALRALGLEDSHIASSRNLEFRERFLEATDGRGVDVVLGIHYAGVRRCVARAARAGRSLPGDGQDRHSRAGGRRGGASGRPLSGLRSG